MSRSALYILAMGLVSTAIIAVMIFGIGTAFSVMFMGGLADVIDDCMIGIWDMNTTTGIAKIICSGPVALASIWIIQKLLDVCNWLGRWKAERV